MAAQSKKTASPTSNLNTTTNISTLSTNKQHRPILAHLVHREMHEGNNLNRFRWGGAAAPGLYPGFGGPLRPPGNFACYGHDFDTRGQRPMPWMRVGYRIENYFRRERPLYGGPRGYATGRSLRNQIYYGW